MYKVQNLPKPPLGIPIGNESYNTSIIRPLSNINGYKCIQMNGQRNWIRSNIDFDTFNEQPSLDCEIFVGKIPYNVFEDDLIPLLSQAGTLHELRLLIQFNGSNRGYAFARYTTIQEAKNAIDMFDNYPIRPNRKLGLMFAIQNTTLYIRQLPKHVSIAEVVKLVRQNTKGMVQVHINRESTKTSLTITYESHRDATLARKQIISDAIQEWNVNLYIDIKGPPSSSENKYNESAPSTSDHERSFSPNKYNDGASCSFY